MALDIQPLDRFRDLLARARHLEATEAALMSLATVGADGWPAVREIYLQAVDDTGLVFFTHDCSRKARQLAENPRAAACFYWPALGQQVQVEGVTEPVDDATADDAWAGRSRESQLAAWASRQSRPLDSDEALTARVADYRKRFDFQRQIPRPAHWCGYRLVPERIEFWSSGWRYLHVRERYERDAHAWVIQRLEP
ncbi:pyridoxamine 5'-phosphate oxidase [Arhodomonas sp. AD133]|uniref:pyridoxamine 5'-phosphate oxidase n=1 Tax=Arhodomonas sp. AD133 TaxID=3415009 RepID=UPI003EB8A17A